MRAALLQMTSTDIPAENLETVKALMAEAVRGGAGFVLTPEVTNCLSGSRTHQNGVLCHEEDDPTLAALQEEAARHGVWLLLGSLGIKTHDDDGRFANRQFLISPEGEIKGRYDKIHMFDVEVTPEETYRESDGYRPGTKAVVAETPFAKIGMTICYDVRFPHLHRALAKGGAQIVTAPAAFSYVTGAAHWHSLLRARAIETGCFVLAPAQTGKHPASRGPSRKTFGHSLAVAPWGEILADAGQEPGVTYVDLDMEKVAEARKRVPSLTHDREFDGP
ncbi:MULTISPECIES: carbon-nitrogen hydrolase family protein [unclassified Leisingera]|uniref:carbon-nitrogen hydrolase family protein n=1 Tax=unclassified Leisingera TaxID=2614906 RepID=UPI0002E1DF4C|nr:MULTISPECIES: carbon-nitrogen hydrolase family protein [unclassified Leisingera]KIC18258.1 amidohydrolase [Leisingera sp. ANG-DT]KIC24314.1 amidohydrolase [Leisingera sp. ANG-S3]KIC27894.1 amidohydrolase [Leisingera sp. ANG-M6]KIC53030.1 amidohydrolase [Leisingera sp. ANG-S]KID10070.1 amidohydrolase [Leisingera sp. ANG1]